MKIVYLVLALISLPTFAKAKGVDRGYACSITYQSSGSFGTVASGNGWLADGQSLNDDMKVNKVTVKQTASHPETFWQFSIEDKNGKSLATVSVPEKKGFQINVPVKFTDPNESEDPPEYNLMTVSCNFTFLAG